MPRTRTPAPVLNLVPASMPALVTLTDQLSRHLDSIADIHASYQMLALRVGVNPALAVNPLHSAPMQVAAFMRILNSSMSMHMQSMQKLLLERQQGLGD